jgi:outer membrane biogenesis lipoprotein LolB
MKTFALHLLIMALALLAGCSAGDKSPDVHPDDALKKLERVSYYDRNGDGKVDLEMHRYKGAQDADWALHDDDYNGRFETKILYGIGIMKKPVDIPVPTNVSISPNPKE